MLNLTYNLGGGRPPLDLTINGNQLRINKNPALHLNEVAIAPRKKREWIPPPGKSTPIPSLRPQLKNLYNQFDRNLTKLKPNIRDSKPVLNITIPTPMHSTFLDESYPMAGAAYRSNVYGVHVPKEQNQYQQEFVQNGLRVLSEIMDKLEGCARVLVRAVSQQVDLMKDAERRNRDNDRRVESLERSLKELRDTMGIPQSRDRNVSKKDNLFQMMRSLEERAKRNIEHRKPESSLSQSSSEETPISVMRNPQHAKYASSIPKFERSLKNIEESLQNLIKQTRKSRYQSQPHQDNDYGEVSTLRCLRKHADESVNTLREEEQVLNQIRAASDVAHQLILKYGDRNSARNTDVKNVMSTMEEQMEHQQDTTDAMKADISTHERNMEIEDNEIDLPKASRSSSTTTTTPVDADETPRNVETLSDFESRGSEIKISERNGVLKGMNLRLQENMKSGEVCMNRFVDLALSENLEDPPREYEQFSDRSDEMRGLIADFRTEFKQILDMAKEYMSKYKSSDKSTTSISSNNNYLKPSMEEKSTSTVSKTAFPPSETRKVYATPIKPRVHAKSLPTTIFRQQLLPTDLRQPLSSTDGTILNGAQNNLPFGAEKNMSYRK